MGSSKAMAFLRLCRPANLPTAAADSIAGMALAGIFVDVSGFRAGFDNFDNPFFLVLTSVFLYAGGVVLNDFFDAEIDKLERPERPIPQGLVHKTEVAVFGGLLLVLGIGTAFLVNTISGSVALLLAFFIVLYDAFSKKDNLLGPLNMGLCRGLNLLLGVTIFGHFINWEYTLVPMVFVAAITTISRGEVHGRNKKNIFLAAFLYAAVIFGVVYLHSNKNITELSYLIFLAAFALMVFLPLIRAYRVNSPENIKRAVIAGVLSLILLDATIVVGHSNWQMGLLLVLLLPLSIFLSKIFNVT